MEKLLEMLCTKKENVMIYSCGNTQNFKYGKILAIDDNNIAIYMISPNGTFDGIVIMKKENIGRIDVGGLYEEKMQKLCKNQEFPEFNYSFEDVDLRKRILEIAQETARVVSVELQDSGYDDIQGKVAEIGENTIKVNLIDEYGNEDGVSYFVLDNITSISYFTETEQRVQRLYEFLH